jgi:long-chain fatty acid transport protein
MPHAPRLHAIAVAVATATVLTTQQIQASGFAVPELSVLGVGTANALVANPDDPGAIPYNPAAIAFHQQSVWSAGTLLINPNFTVRTDTGKHDSEGAEWHALPLLNAAVHVDDKWALGMSVNAPFGLETRWPVGTFPELTREAPLPAPLPELTVPLSAQPTQSKAEIIDFTPTLTYAINDSLAVAAGANIYWVKSAQFNSTLTQVDGDGSGFGFNVSAMFVQDALSLGLNFHSSATLALEGFYTATNPTLVQIYQGTNGMVGIPPSQSAELDLDLPWRLQLGVRYEITDDIAAEVDWTRTGWSEFQELRIDLKPGGTLVSDRNEWNDANAYRFGVTYQVHPNTQLRFGYSYDETPQGDDYFTPRIPDSDRHLFALGLGQSLGQGWELEAAYMYVMNEERDYTGARPYTGGATNGTTAYAGDYDAHAHLISLGISKRFDAF